ncbi:hypothetical protein BDZ91DRAFT_827029 [Kalaharituber pfeilii]|nr:hypothetical protein BDZ91DRAFT_827029 [Kalaharituber pfeilii]
MSVLLPEPYPQLPDYFPFNILLAGALFTFCCSAARARVVSQLGGRGFHGVTDSDSRPQSASSGTSAGSTKRTVEEEIPAGAFADTNEDGQSVADEHPADAHDEQSPTLPWLAPLYNAFSISSPLPPPLLAAAGGAAPELTIRHQGSLLFSSPVRESAH